MAILARIKKATKFGDFLNKFKKKLSLNVFQYIDVNHIKFLESKTRNDVIFELVDLLDNSKIHEKKKFYKKIIEREKIVSTGIGMGVAIPHAKIENFDDFFIAIGIQKQHKINWNSIDRLPVRLVFMIGGPEVKQNEYLQLLSKLTIALRDDNLRRNLLRANNKEEIIQMFHQF